MIKQFQEITTAYAERYDMTFIIKESWKVVLAEDGTDKIVDETTEVVGFYWGEPNDEATKKFVGKLKAQRGELEKLDIEVVGQCGNLFNVKVKQWGELVGYVSVSRYIISGKETIIVDSQFTDGAGNFREWVSKEQKKEIKAFIEEYIG